MYDLKDVVAQAIIRETRFSRSGLELSWWLDCRILYPSMPAIMSAFPLIEETAIAGIESVGWDMARAFAAVHPETLSIFRITKDYQVYEYVNSARMPPRPTILVLCDDVVSTGESISTSETLLGETRCPVISRYAIMDRRADRSLPVDSLFTPEDFDLPLI